ncbi:ribosomal-processing cysteine protease Prp [Streptomyces chartreusis]|uniref:ribosomal-processing cysteine protease Prp n=1 Tax=Streptomyces chartreusis TaxID=1969 RepID=UPI003813D53E
MTIQVRARLGDGRTSIEVDGHEGHVENGRVCAAVTAITHTALLGLQAVAEQHPDLVSVEITLEQSDEPEHPPA